jgi:glycosyltransferase involved in cell wall biosynthesis
VVLQIASPMGCRSYRPYGKPSVMYTQHALDGLPPAWVDQLAGADSIVVPSEFDRAVFARHFESVFVAPQSSDPAVFRPLGGRARRDEFEFLYVGTYGFRKGVDMLVEAFVREFDPLEPVTLTLHCASLGERETADHAALLRDLDAGPRSRVRIVAGDLRPEEMNTLYNRSDCVVTLSRGEGWCMPLSEALLCETPVIAPRSTGMLEYLDDSIAELVTVRPLPAADAGGRMGAPFAAAYGYPGINYYEPSVAEAQAAMRRVYADHGSARAKARAGRRRMLADYTWERTAATVAEVCRRAVAAAQPAAAPLSR